MRSFRPTPKKTDLGVNESFYRVKNPMAPGGYTNGNRAEKERNSDDFGLRDRPSFRNRFRQKEVYLNTSIVPRVNNSTIRPQVRRRSNFCAPTFALVCAPLFDLKSTAFRPMLQCLSVFGAPTFVP